MTSNNKNKGESANSPLETLHHLQSELFTLREKHINVLEKALIIIEKEETTLKTQLDKARVQLKLYQERLKDPKNAKPSVQGRIKTSVASLQRNIESDQAQLALLRGKIIEQRLQLRKEKAVLKAMLDTDKSLGKPLSKANGSAKTSAAKKTAVKTTPPAAAKAPANPASKTAPKVHPEAAPKTTAKPKATSAAQSVKPEAPPALASNPAPADLPRPKRRVRRMSDIPSHPDKQADRLASLFDDF
ncbi:hypothetical protein AB4876_02945 [Zhongshania guokunii]|uniref:Uncharacterized protein n=1 Tax=Zhongshania guokunii TaxID=641783 RepID=A0ABV3U1R6_9GAMM